MATERLHMSGEQRYHGYEAAAHVARYALARTLCAERRVLDIACGEGYGSALLARWGARQVVGIDISAEAIAAANRHFGHPSIRFLQGNAEQAPALLANEPPFELVVSFETIEHVADPAALLRGLRQLCAPGGSILVSCPNDPAALQPGDVNPYHNRSYTFEQFRALSEGILGPAAAWLIEAPVVGLLLYALGDPAAELPAASAVDIVKLRNADQGFVQMPAQEGVSPSAQDCLAYVGVWGDLPQPVCAVSPMSQTGYMFPWRKLDRLQAEMDRLYQSQQEDRRQLLHDAALIANYEQSHAADQQQIERQRKTIAHAEAVHRLASERTEALEAEGRQARERLRELTLELDRMRDWRGGMERSRFYRLLRRYTRLYETPVVGPALGLSRNAARRALRAIRRR